MTRKEWLRDFRRKPKWDKLNIRIVILSFILVLLTFVAMYIVYHKTEIFTKTIVDKQTKELKEAYSNETSALSTWEKVRHEELLDIMMEERIEVLLKDRGITGEMLELLEENPDIYANLHFDRGIIHFRKGEYGEAVKEFNNSVKLYEDSWASWNNLGASLFRQEISNCEANSEEILYYFNRAYALNPEITGISFNIGNMLHCLEKWDVAVPFFEFVTENDRNNSIAWYRLAVSYFGAQNYNSSNFAADKAIELGVNTSFFWKLKFNLSLGYEDYDKQLRTLDLIIDSGCDCDFMDTAWYLKGRILHFQYLDYPNALIAFNKSIELNDQSERAWFLMGESLEFLGRIPEAIESYKIGYKLNPENVLAGHTLDKIRFHMNVGDYWHYVGPEKKLTNCTERFMVQIIESTSGMVREIPTIVFNETYSDSSCISANFVMYRYSQQFDGYLNYFAPFYGIPHYRSRENIEKVSKEFEIDMNVLWEYVDFMNS